MSAKEIGHDEPEGLRPGASFEFASDAERRAVLTDVRDYRGDVTLRLDDGTILAGYVFSLEPSALKLMTPERTMTLPLARIAGCVISGRDTADGRSWEAWVRRYEEKKRLAAQGIDMGDIEPQPEQL